MTDEMMKEVLARLDMLAGKLGVGGEAIWAMLLRQAPIAFFTDLVVIALTGLGWWVLFKKLLPAAQAANMDQEFSRAVACIVVGVICSMLTIAILISMENIVASLVNPEYWAFQQIMKLKAK